MHAIYPIRHLDNCQDRFRWACTCRLYLITACGALLASLSNLLIGWESSLALVSEAPHGLVDALSDFVALGLLLWHGKETDEGRWHWFLAAILALAACGIAYEAYERMQLPAYPLSGAHALVGTIITYLIHRTRVRLLKAAGPPSRIRNGVIRHANSDKVHSGLVIIPAILVTLVQGFSVPLPFRIKWVDLALTAILVAYMLFQSLKIARGDGCGHAHDHGDGAHDHAHCK